MEVHSLSTVQSAFASLILKSSQLGIRRALTRSRMEDMDLTLVTVAARDVGKLHVMGQGVYDAAERRRQASREDQLVAVLVSLEEHELRIELQRLGIVEINFAYFN